MSCQRDETDAHACVVFDREWALCVLERGLVELEAWYKKQGRGPAFEVLRRFLPGAQLVPSAEASAASLGISVEVLRVDIHRARNRLLQNLSKQILETVPAADVDEELKYLADALAKS